MTAHRRSLRRVGAKALHVLALCCLVGCGSDSKVGSLAPGAGGSVPGAGGAATSGGAPAMGAAPAVNGGAPTGGGGVSSSGTAGTGASAAAGGLAGMGGGTSGGGVSATGGAGPTGGGPATGGTVSAGGTSPSGGASGAGGAPIGPIPTPMSAPLVWGFGIGVTDMPAAVKFYSEVMKMTVEKDSVKRDDRTETTLYGTQAMRGARLVLMKFDDMRNTTKITTKLVWQAQNAAAVNTAAATYPGYVSRLNIGIVQFDGPETYIQEVGGIFDSGGAAITVPYPIAIGFAVSDQPASRKLYTSLGMTESSLGSFSVTDVNGAGTIAEYSVKFTDGMGVVLQQWTPARNAKNNPVKVVMFVPDAKAMADKVVAGGGMIVTPAARSQAYDNRLLIVAKDLDGYILEIVE